MKNTNVTEEKMVYVENRSERPVVVRHGKGTATATDAVRVWATDSFMVEALPDRPFITPIPHDAWEAFSATEFGKALIGLGALKLTTREAFERQEPLPWQHITDEDEDQREEHERQTEHRETYRPVVIR
ncbi:hypothetical protein [Paraburkholderia ferrariae]|uniref:Uncharacterized protein n=1 Tax=Paraburkholderia ferrariae TaxID=386056 RepID=A0ABU9RZS9_9BURK